MRCRRNGREYTGGDHGKQRKDDLSYEPHSMERWKRMSRDSQRNIVLLVVSYGGWIGEGQPNHQQIR